MPKKNKKKVTKKKVTKIKNKKDINKITKTTEVKTDSLRIPKSNEIKPEIKKVKKQESEKKEYKIKDFVVYPKHGVGQISEVKKINIGGIDVETYVIKFEKDKANGMVPVNKQSHLRPLATINQGVALHPHRRTIRHRNLHPKLHSSLQKVQAGAPLSTLLHHEYQPHRDCHHNQNGFSVR